MGIRALLVRSAPRLRRHGFRSMVGPMNLLRPLFAVPRLPLTAVLWFALAPTAGVFAAPVPSPTPAATPADAPGAAPSATPSPEIAAEVAKEAGTADSLWNYIKKWSDLSDLENLDPTLDPEAKMNAAKALVHGKIAHLHPAVDEFLKRYPQDVHHWNALLLRVLFLRGEEGISDESVNNTLQQIAHAPDAPMDIKRQARGALLQDTLEKADPSSGLTEALDKELTAYEKDFPDDPTGAQLVTLRLRMLQNTPDKINPTLAVLSKSPNRSTAEAATKQLDMRTKPLELKFTALDGKEVDLAKLRGKVVLLDFWATWCGPCMAKLPEILDLQKKYKDKDFQLIGISLDQDKAALEETLKNKGMDWPQYFDGKGWQSDLAARFGVEAIPATWIVDKKGLAHELDPDTDLDTEVSKLLADGVAPAPVADAKKP